ncbi:MAG: aminotransferase class I/II-fold pyridoxal phosphate-dependent enzyme [Gemmatirosa sp.]|nr:aminotransferase class I/II-fold pyridoxal phosphate-dependent enzyme [Gemmatirosa sp.]
MTAVALPSRTGAPNGGVVQRMVAAARRLEAEGRDVVRVDIGEPDFATPAHIVEAGARALRDGATKYVAPAGLPALRAAIAHSVAARGVEAAAEQVVVTAGARPMLWYALQALVGRGDGVLLPDPGYPGYAAAVHLAGGVAVRYALAATPNGFRLDVDALRAAVAPDVRVLVLNAPGNPTGLTLDEAERAAVAALALERDLWVVTDEIYSAIAFDRSAPTSIAALPGMAARTVLVDGFSKTYAMTGWRLGYGVMPRAVADSVAALVAECTTCTPAFVQHAGLAALAGPQDAVADMRDAYRQRRDLLVRGLSAIPGVVAPPPRGAFYTFADVSGAMARGPWTSSDDLAADLLDTHGVACVPGSAYGVRGEGHLRLALTAAPARLEEGVRRIAACLGA